MNDAKFRKFQLENLVDFEKCCKTHIYLQKSVPIQPRTSPIKLDMHFAACVEIYEKFVKFQKFQLDNLVDFEKC